MDERGYCTKRTYGQEEDERKGCLYATALDGATDAVFLGSVTKIELGLAVNRVVFIRLTHELEVVELPGDGF